MRVVVTAGHVDHGKSTLVRRLTGTDPDRLAEERARGLTIDLGFAATVLPSGRDVGFVDVPGHVRFIKNMLAGVGAADACLFVVAANEGWKPQSEEHLRILELVGLTHGIVALTKVGLVDEEWRDLASMEIADHLAGTFLAGAPIVPVDVPAGIGVDELVAALDALVESTPAAADLDRPRLWIDRSFALAGTGTVVTGTLTGGGLRVDEHLAIVPGRRRVRIRGLHSHGRRLDAASPGRRLALNLTGAAHGDLHRGQALVRDAQWHRSTVFDGTLAVLASLEHEVTRRGAYVAYLGTGEHPVRLTVLGARSIEPGVAGLVRVRLPLGLPLAPGDRYVLRESGRAQTVGGGEVLDVAPVLPVSRAAPSRSVDRVVAERGWVDAGDLERLTGERRPPTVGSWVVSPAALGAAALALRAEVAAAGGAGLDVALLDERRRAVCEASGELVVEAGRVRLLADAGAAGRLRAHPWLTALEAAPFAPPAPDGVDRAEVRQLVQQGLVVDSGDGFYAASALEEAGRVVARLLAGSPEGVTTSLVREELATNRRHALAILGRLDAMGVTRRQGDVRVGGPRLPARGPAIVDEESGPRRSP